MRTCRGEVDPPFDILEPVALKAGLVFNSPHSGRVYPEAFLEQSRLHPEALRRSEDTLVDELVLGVVGRGVPLMRAHFPRAFLDVNREPYELDPRMFSGRLPAYANTRSLRVAGGLGTIARIVSEAEEIYARPLPVQEALGRIERYHKPYHRALHHLTERTRAVFGSVLLIDCHSMPSHVRSPADRHRADFVVGDRYGSSAAPHVVDAIIDTLSGLGFLVQRNKPYAGGFITEQYGQPGEGRHAVQIEINRALYLDERTFLPTAGFAGLSAALMVLAERLIALPLDSASFGAEAAE